MASNSHLFDSKLDIHDHHGVLLTGPEAQRWWVVPGWVSGWATEDMPLYFLPLPTAPSTLTVGT